MLRLAFTMRLKPDALPEYKYHHDNLWPELAEEIERAGIGRITTFQRGLDLFLISEVEDEKAWERLWTSEVHQRWAEVMRPLMQMRDDGIVETAELAEVFHFEVGQDPLLLTAADDEAEMAREPASEVALAEPSDEATLADSSEELLAEAESLAAFAEGQLARETAYGQSSWQESSGHAAGGSNGVTLVEAIVVAVVDEPQPMEESSEAPMEAPPAKEPPPQPSRKMRPARRVAGKKPKAKAGKRKAAKPTKKKTAKRKPVKKAAAKKALPKKKPAKKKSPTKKKASKKKPAKKR